LEEATAENDEDQTTIISEQKEELRAKLRNPDRARCDLSVKPEQIEQQGREWLAKKVKKVEDSTYELSERSQRKIELEEQLERLEREHIRDLNQLRSEKKGKDAENKQLKKQQRALEEINEKLARERAGNEKEKDKEKKKPSSEWAELGFLTLLQQRWGFNTPLLTKPLLRVSTFPHKE
jgi:hypothetical protein